MHEDDRDMPRDVAPRLFAMLQEMLPAAARPGATSFIRANKARLTRQRMAPPSHHASERYSPEVRRRAPDGRVVLPPAAKCSAGVGVCPRRHVLLRRQSLFRRFLRLMLTVSREYATPGDSARAEHHAPPHPSPSRPRAVVLWRHVSIFTLKQPR